MTDHLDLVSILSRYASGLDITQLREQAAGRGFWLTAHQMRGRLMLLKRAGHVEYSGRYARIWRAKKEP